MSPARLIIPTTDPYWLLRVPVEYGGSTPYQLWILWAYQLATVWEFNA